MARTTKKSRPARTSSKRARLFLCFDLGGTKLRAALVRDDGRILDSVTEPVDQSAGVNGMVELFRELSRRLPREKYAAVSVASAGPLDPDRGVLLDPTNFFTDLKSWGVVPLVSHLKRVFKMPVYLENDAACAVLGEAWRGGHGRGARNLLAMTLGTGVGIGIVANGELVRAGRGLHTEVSHMPIRAGDKNYPCGCGAYGCIEAFLGGNLFAKRMSARVGRVLTGREFVALAQGGDVPLQASFKEYGRDLAQAVRSLCVGFAPEVVVLSGGFSHAWRLFLPETEKTLPALMERYREGVDLLPKVKVSRLQDDAGILGAAFLAAHRS